MQNKKRIKRIFNRKLIIWIISVISLVIISKYSINQIRINRFNTVVSEYLQIENYQDAKNLFDRDFKIKELKYFTYGMFYDKKYYRKLKKKYDLEIFHMGCIIEGRLSKYNHYIETEVMDDSFKKTNYFGKVDSILVYFIKSLDTKDYNYLISNSSDSITVSFGLFNDSIEGKYDAKYLFENYSDRMSGFENLSTNSSNDDRDSLIFFFRRIDSLPTDNKTFNLRFTFIKVKDKYFFNEIVIL